MSRSGRSPPTAADRGPGRHELNLQIHNPTDQPTTARVTRSPLFDFVTCDNFGVKVPAGKTVEYVLKGKGVSAR